MRRIGLDLGASQFRLVEVTGTDSHGRLQLGALGAVDTPPTAVRGGAVVDATAAAGAIAELFRTVGVPSRGVHVALAGRGTAVKVRKLPAALPATAWEQAYKLNSEDLSSSVKNADSYIAFTPVPGAPVDKDRSLSVAAIHQDIVHATLEALAAARVAPATLTLAGAAAFRAVTTFPTDDATTCTGLVDIGHSKFTVALRKGHAVIALATVEAGGQSILDALRGEFGIQAPEAIDLLPAIRLGEETQALMSPSQALAQTYGGFEVAAPNAQGGPTESVSTRANRAADNASGELAAEIARTLSSLVKQTSTAPDSLALCGRTALIQGFTRLVEQATGRPSAVKRPFMGAEPKAVKILGTDAPQALLPYTVAAGAAMTGLKQ